MKKVFLILSILLSVNFSIAYDLFITEMMYNPQGDDKLKEWVEILNKSNKTFNILSGRSGWKVNDGKNHTFKEDVVVYPNEILIVAKNKEVFLKEYPFFKGKIIEANFVLKNKGGEFSIFDNNKNLITFVSYSSSCGGNGNGFSISFEDGNCFENKIIGGSPGDLTFKKYQDQENKKKSTSSFNEQNNQNTSFQSTSSFQDNLESKSKDDKLKTDLSLLSENTSSLQDSFYQTVKSKEIKTTLLISEFLPNPEGNDYGQEFVEIYNYGEEAINLDEFFLVIGNKKINLQGTIEGQEYFVLTNKDYSFYIRNKGETLSLYFNEEQIFKIIYEGKAPIGQSFSRKNSGEWEFTNPTPGKENIFLDNLISENQKNNLLFKREFLDGSNLKGNMVKKSDFLDLKNNLTKEGVFENRNEIIFLIGAILIILILVFIVWLRL